MNIEKLKESFQQTVKELKTLNRSSRIRSFSEFKEQRVAQLEKMIGVINAFLTSDFSQDEKALVSYNRQQPSNW